MCCSYFPSTRRVESSTIFISSSVNPYNSYTASFIFRSNDVQRSSRRFVSPSVLLIRLRVAQVHQKHGGAADAGRIDGAGERHGDARLGIESVQGIDDVQVGTVGGANCAVRFWQLHSLEGALPPVWAGEAVARERAATWLGQVEPDADPRSRGQQRRAQQRAEHNVAGRKCRGRGNAGLLHETSPWNVGNAPLGTGATATDCQTPSDNVS